MKFHRNKPPKTIRPEEGRPLPTGLETLAQRHGLDSQGRLAIHLVHLNPRAYPKLHEMLEKKREENSKDPKSPPKSQLATNLLTVGGIVALVLYSHGKPVFQNNAENPWGYAALPFVYAGRYADIAATRMAICRLTVMQRHLRRDMSDVLPQKVLNAFFPHPWTYEATPIQQLRLARIHGRDVKKEALKQTLALSVPIAAFDRHPPLLLAATSALSLYAAGHNFLVMRLSSMRKDERKIKNELNTLSRELDKNRTFVSTSANRQNPT